MPFPGTTNLPVVMSQGENNKVSAFSLDQPNLARANNVIYNKLGQIDKRTGLTAISPNILGGGVIFQGAAITTFEDQLIALDGTSLYSWQPQEQVWIDKGSAFSVINQQYKILNTKIATQSNPDVTTSDNISVYVWEDNRAYPVSAQGIRYSVVDNETGAFIVSDRQIYGLGSRPKVITDGYDYFIFYNASNTNIFLTTIPCDRSNTITSQYIPIITDGYSNNGIAYDATPKPGGGYLLTYSSINGVNLTDGTNNALLSLNADMNTIGTFLDDNNIFWVAYSDGLTTYMSAFPYIGGSSLVGVALFQDEVVINSATGTSFNAVNLCIGGNLDYGNVILCAEISSGTPNYNNYVNVFAVSNNPNIVNISHIGQIRSVGLASKIFSNDGQIFVNTVNASNLQATYFTHCLTRPITTGDFINNLSTFTIVSTHSPSNGGTYRTNTILSQCDLMTPEQYLFAGQRKGAFTSYENAQTVNLGCAGYSVDFDNPNAFNNVTSNNDLHLVGGVKSIFDGVSVVEDNFFLFPELPDGYGCDIVLQTTNAGAKVFNSTTGNLGWSALTDGYQYQWLAIYEWTENNTQVQRGGVSIANTAVTTGNDYGALLTVPTLRLTAKINARSPVSISIYRTQGNLPIFYKVTDDSNPIINDPTVDTITFFDGLSDADIAANENLYTGSQLSNTVPPSCSLISLYQNRLMINSTEDVNVLWYSQNKFDQSQYNTLPLDWNTSFVEGVDSRFNVKTGITAIGLLDNALAVFKESSIFLLTGDGPNALDTADQFNDAQLMVSTVGCTNQNSLCFITQTPNSPGGLLFQSKQGIYLLGRDQSITYIGSPVERFNNITITSANVMTKSNQVVFTSLEGICLVYNYFFNAWTVWDNLPCVSATVWQDQLVIMTNEGSVMIQDITNTIYVDTFANNNALNVQSTITTPWIKYNGSGNLQGRMCVYSALILGTLQAPHTLQIQVAYDYDESIRETVIINSNTAANRWGALPLWGNPGGIWGNFQFSNYQFQMNLKYPRGFYGVGAEAIKLTITDLNPDGNAGYSLNGLQLEVQPVPGPYLVPVGNTIGTH
jgi:hypothetical protein